MNFEVCGDYVPMSYQILKFNKLQLKENFRQWNTTMNYSLV